MNSSPVDKIFWGRVRFQQANAVLFFTKESIVQKIIFELKYKQNKKAGLLLGRLIAQDLLSNIDYPKIDYLIPIPISKKKLKKRGFNQCQIICEGIVSNGLNAHLFQGLTKTKNTQTQTHKDRLQRSNQTNDLFKLTNSDVLLNKNILIIDDVLTTGATVEAAYHCLIEAKPATISITTAAYTIT
jgi:ComF family protein